jgi:potassium-transporting ATPase ATP-binding subunit
MRTSSSTGEIRPRPLFEAAILRPALWAALGKLNPLHQLRNPVMFTVWICSALTTALYAQALAGRGEARAGFILAVALWLWFTLVFANFAEAMAEGRGKAQADALRATRRDV